jgi:hypothetical protein
MKKRLFAIKSGFVLACACAATALASDKGKNFEDEFAHVPLPELPARAIAVVNQAPVAERAQTAILAVQTILQQHPAAAPSVIAALSKAAPDVSDAVTESITPQPAGSLHALGGNGKGNGNGNGNGNGKGNGKGNGDENGNAGGNGGVGRGPGPDKPGHIVDHDGPIKTILPNGKPRHFPPDPPHRPVKPPRPVHYNKPGED